MPLINQTFSQLITFTRASSATYVDARGLIQSASTNVPRFDYNPSTLAPSGLLIEEQRTNLLTYSEAASTSPWVLTNITASIDTVVAPDGATTADTLTEGVGAQIQFANTQSRIIVSGQTITLSRYVKRGTGVLRGFRLECDGGANGFRANFNPDTGAVSSSSVFGAGVVLSSGSEPAANGFRRYYVTGTLGTSTSISNHFRFTETPTSPNIGYTGDGIQSFVVWGAQLEAGSFPTSYIPTVASQVTRAADVASVNNLSPWYNMNEGTLYVETGPTVDNIYPTGSVLTDGTSANNILIQAASPATSQQFYVVSNGVAQVNLATQAFSSTLTKTAAAYKTNDFAYSTQGAVASTDVAGSIPTVSQLVIGAERTSSFFNGHIRRIVFYPSRLSNANLQTITA